MHRRTHARLIGAACAAFALLAACGNDATAPTIESVAGSYTATQMTATTSAFSWDFLDLGGSLDVVLNENGTMNGHLFIPASITFPIEVDEVLTGTWSLSGSTVTFTTQDDVYLVGDLAFRVRGNTLVGDETIGDPMTGQARVRVTLRRD